VGASAPESRGKCPLQDPHLALHLIVNFSASELTVERSYASGK